ncbi:MAG: 1-acyl-sn-glycerol-3-phosphate acyltransferase [Alphaproteobacteria bacterium]|nr:1-acyl-sn-glycerol-3-phosphate acyltransferase [Alphaproteobacteria bacterium]
MKEIQSPYKLRIILRATLLFVWTIFWLIPVFVMWLLRSQSIRRWLVHMHLKGVVSILSLKVKVVGELSTKRPLLLVANHASYADIFIIGSKLPVSFTPKREIRSWPVIGFMAVLADCVFVERKPSQMQEAREEMLEKLDMGKVVCIFPEGTTNDGLNVKPFKSGFFSLAENYNLPVQPVTISYTHINDQLIPDTLRDHVAWVGEATFFGHFLRLMGYQSITATMHFHPPQLLEDFEDRKALSGACQVMVQTQHAKTLADAR